MIDEPIIAKMNASSNLTTNNADMTERMPSVQIAPFSTPVFSDIFVHHEGMHLSLPKQVLMLP